MLTDIGVITIPQFNPQNFDAGPTCLTAWQSTRGGYGVAAELECYLKNSGLSHHHHWSSGFDADRREDGVDGMLAVDWLRATLLAIRSAIPDLHPGTVYLPDARAGSTGSVDGGGGHILFRALTLPLQIARDFKLGYRI